ncbi:hypothetical protein C3L33_05029, partial [Rhododendron williamsianum]
MKASRMFGDQLALAWVVKSHPYFDAKRFTRPQAFQEEIGGASDKKNGAIDYSKIVREFFSTHAGYSFQGIEETPDAQVLELLEWFLVFRHMLCLILSSGRSKYDF